ncbi:MAG: tRNA (adenosine(37)-N6)-dimethylallyltransferase MiaA [Deltaproteobacteria bacterium]|jgi:tRNA dimethylallyltransferase|nr:tRNA (adenosine(37)-N6)-dimethylallyltransferase MiaA [Deltaproteobacteria bacterium]MBT4091042.1 tRNA (adenosine(37)-N6)-dimethylallyltransferase MiaA [Deltaproteobacteria bacterium]MBT4263924.1 tRNA (adenosine(37)-N6)-dimethylallyltransferase MiaA [Deltaproteobacteria bacterium]MBT4639867.1 tRNA (adenosine(37)-N6)-dimethylallyltransferase MiaA [Deltaproteobacteria bacterium]MBT6503448.1 tRNA (adenosine(37)-N6)-dimethylallyltransferase MiaA [Deltaproteobacteria bacterium]
MGRKTKTIIILGPTASGKTALAVQLAGNIGGEIVSADSRQVFKDMDIGSGKDLSEYQSIPYHLIDIRRAGDSYSVSEFQQDALSALSDIAGRRSVPIICGGTGHYVKSLLDDYCFAEQGTDLVFTENLESLSRESLYEKIKSVGLWETHHWQFESRRRMARAIEKQLLPQTYHHPRKSFNDLYNPLCVYIQIERKILISRIEQRLKDRLQSGLVEEVKRLLDNGISHHRLERYGLEYRWVSLYLKGDIEYQEMFQKLVVEIRRYAKRQMTFIRYLQKKGHRLEPASDPAAFLARVDTWLLE